MNTNSEPKKKSKRTKKTKCNLPNGIFSRLSFVIAFEEDSTQIQPDSSIFESYTPHVLGSSTTLCKMPTNPLDVNAFQSVTDVNGRTPYYIQPKLPQSLPGCTFKGIFTQPTYPSLIPLLITAKSSGIDTRHYHVVSQRNSLRKIAMNDEDFVINVVRFGTTLFMRLFLNYRVINKNDVGHRFEELCTSKCIPRSNRNISYNQLVEGRIGKHTILMLGETDAINNENGESVELKCKIKDVNKFDERDWWLQAYLTGTKTIIHGRRAKGDETITKLKQYSTSSLIDRQTKMQMFNRLDSVLNFLYSNVVITRTYMLVGRKGETTKQCNLRLYEVIDDKDKEKLSFITDNLLHTFFVDK